MFRERGSEMAFCRVPSTVRRARNSHKMESYGDTDSVALFQLVGGSAGA